MTMSESLRFQFGGAGAHRVGFGSLDIYSLVPKLVTVSIAYSLNNYFKTE